MENQIAKAVQTLQQGGIIIFPTDTAFGIGCAMDDEKAIERLFRIRRRPDSQATPVLVDTVKMAQDYLQPIPQEVVDKLIEPYWPGALTIISGVKSEVKKNDLAKGVVSEKNTLALRVTDQPILKYLSSKLALPLVSTSANISGIESTHDVDEVIEAFGKRQEQPDAVFDYGRLLICRPTTVASVINGKVEILRQGEVHLSMCIS